MSTQHLGMYVHQHWGYAHPFSARTWTFSDWKAYTTGLAALGYDTVMIWPILETTPYPPTESDVANLTKLGRVIDMLHDDLGFQAIVTLGANTVANERAAQYRFDERPYFLCDERLNPASPAEMERLMEIRRGLLRYLGRADGFSIIDSDPGGYVGSTNEQFLDILWRHLEVVQSFNPAASILYWMWVGWEPYCDFWEEMRQPPFSPPVPKRDGSPWEPVIRAMAEQGDAAWKLFVCWDQHRELAEQYGLQDRSWYLPYGLIEGEPTFPFTNWNPAHIERHARAGLGSGRLGLMGNAQTHAVQLPNTYLLSHFAHGGTLENMDLRGFAERLAPGLGMAIAAGWQAMESRDAHQARESADMLASHLLGRIEGGDLAGLMLMSPDRFVEDLVLQLRFCADMDACAAAAQNGGVPRDALKALANSWRRWWGRHRYNDAYGGPVVERLHPALRSLRDPTLDAALNRHDEWRYPTVRHGVVPAVLDALEAYLR